MKNKLNRLIYLIVLIFLFSLWPKTFELKAETSPLDETELFLRGLVRSPTPEGLKKHVAENLELARERRLCRAQLSSVVPPVTCFKVLFLEKKIAALSEDQFAKQQEWLIRSCRARVARLNDRRDFPQHIGLEVPSVCMIALRKKQEDLRYIEEKDDPVNLFERRFEKRNFGPDFEYSDANDR